jgi:hypothetical protein
MGLTDSPTILTVSHTNPMVYTVSHTINSSLIAHLSISITGLRGQEPQIAIPIPIGLLTLIENHAKDLIDPFMIKIVTTTIATENLWFLIAHHKTSIVRREISIAHHQGSIAHCQPLITHRGLNEHRRASTLRSWVLIAHIQATI